MIEQDLLEGNKYFKWYWSICNGAKDRVLSPDIYTEKHHIYPKSIYGQNKDLVKLTAKEHYIVHLLLWQGLKSKYGKSNIYTRKMAGAFSMMRCESQDHKKQRYNSKYFEFLRVASYDANKEINLGKKHSIETRKKQSEFRIGKTKSDEHKKNISESLIGKPKNDEIKLNISITLKDFFKKNPECALKCGFGARSVLQFDLSYNFIQEFASLAEAGRSIGIGHQSIYKCCSGKLKQSHNYIWKYKDDFVNNRIPNIKPLF